jgi:glycosyltransferase involved in cell wall biosynthesis
MNKNMKSGKKTKIIAYMDSPTVVTGFATVSRNILEALYKTGRYEIDVLGINYWGNPHNFPYKIWPVGTNNERDPYGRKKIFGMIPQMMGDQTILFFLQDTFILDFLPQLHEKLNADGKKYKSVAYWPVDGKPKEQWLKNVNSVDYPVTYSEWGKKQVFDVYPEFNKDLITIPHGANLKDFYVLNQKDITSFKSQFFGENRDKFVFCNINRNQQRKDIPRMIMAFKEFQKQVPNSILYLHMAPKDQGWNLIEVCNSLGLSTEKDVILPQNFGPNQGYPIEVVNMIYNCSDCIVSTTLGEGAGLSWLEAMATKKPVIFPDNTALTENITEDRGYLVKSGTNPSLFTIIPNDNEILRPLVDVDDMVKTMLHVYNNYDEAMEKAENAYNWISMKMDWQGDIAKKWVEVFDKAAEDLNKNNSIISEKDKVIEAEAV